MNSSTNGGSLFLVELILDLIIFVMCAAVCVALLVHAHIMSTQSTDLTQAVYIAQSYAEQLRTGQTPISDDSSPYQISVDLSDSKHIANAEITVLQGDTVLYALSTTWVKAAEA